MAVKAESRLITVIKEIVEGAEKLDFPAGAIKDAIELAENLMETRLVKKCAPRVVAAVSLYITGKKHGIPLTARDIIKGLDLCKPERTRFLRVSRGLTRELRVRIPLEEYISKIVSELKMPEDVASTAKKIAKRAEELGLTAGRSPLGFAAAAVYLAARSIGIKVSQREVAATAHVTEVTLRVRCKELRERLGLPRSAVRRITLAR